MGVMLRSFEHGPFQTVELGKGERKFGDCSGLLEQGREAHCMHSEQRALAIEETSLRPTCSRFLLSSPCTWGRFKTYKTRWIWLFI